MSELREFVGGVSLLGLVVLTLGGWLVLGFYTMTELDRRLWPSVTWMSTNLVVLLAGAAWGLL